MTPAPFNTLPGDPLPQSRAFWLRAEDGVRLRGAHWAAGGAVGTVLLFPGRTEYIEKYNSVALDLNSAGYDVIGLDWRGQGMSDRLQADPRPGHVGAFRDYQRDVVELLVAADELNLPRPWHLLSHSMGGAIGFAALQDGLPVNSAVFSAPMWGLNLSPVLNRVARLTARMAQVLGKADRVSIGAGGYDPFVVTAGFNDNLLTTDGAHWGRFVAEAAAWPEQCIGGVSYHWLLEGLAECDRMAQCDSPAVPALVTLGADEKIVLPQAIRQRVAAWPGAELLDLPDCRHEALMERPAIREHVLQAAVALFDAHSGVLA